MLKMCSKLQVTKTLDIYRDTKKTPKSGLAGRTDWLYF